MHDDAQTVVEGEGLERDVHLADEVGHGSGS
jgi:hypothetical protein